MSDCNHTAAQSCLRGDECAECLRHMISQLRDELLRLRDVVGEVEYESIDVLVEESERKLNE